MIEIPLQKLPHQEFSIVLDGQNCVLELRQMGSFLYLTLTADEVKICDSHACQSGEPIPVWNTALLRAALLSGRQRQAQGAAVRRTQRSIHSLLRDGRRMAGTYSLKDIRVSITLDKGGANNQFVFQGFATNVSLSKTGGVDFATAQVEIYGLTLPVMGQLTTLAFKPLDRLWNAIEIAAGERGSDLPVIFRGCVTVAYADLNGSSPVLKIEAQVGAYPLLEPASTVSIKGTQDAATFIQSQSAQAGFDFQNDGVKGTLSDTTIYGDPITKIRTATNAIGADVIFDDDKTVLIPKDGVRRAEGGIPLVSAATGMIGYPVFTSQGIQCKTFFRPELRVAAVVKVESIVPHASGTWKITQLTHTLSAHNPGSSTWETSFDGMWQGD